MSKKLTLVFLLTFFASNVAHAIILDFSGLASGNTGSSSLTVGDATFDVVGGTVFVYGPGDFGNFDNGGICALSGGNCETDWTLTFDYAVTDFIFEAAVYDPVDSVLVEAFNGATSLGVIDVFENNTYSFGSAVITSLYFDDSSTGAGFGFGDFSFNRSTAVPEGGTLAFLAIGLLGVVVQRLKRVL